MTEPLLNARQLSKSYQLGPETIQVIEQLDLTIHQGERIAVCGSSGSGKTTLLNLLGALDRFDSGQLTILGEEVNSMNEDQRAQLRNQKLGFVYQFHHLLAEFNALENVAIPLLINRVKKKQAYQQATQLLEQVGLSQRLKHFPSQLSGGERQRAAIARALVTNPCCVLMDEPTGNLDQQNGDAIFQLINHLNQQLGTAFLIVTHDNQRAQQLDYRLELKQGKLFNI